MDVAVFTCDLHAEGSLIENTSAEMTPVASWVVKLPDNSLVSPLVRPNTPSR